MVDGLRCASCVWLIEEVLRRDGVDARCSFGSGQLQLSWSEGTLEQHLNRVQALGYRVRPADASAAVDHDLLVRFGVACFLAANVMALHAALYLGWSDPIDLPLERLFRWLALGLATPAALWCAEPFHRRALFGLQRGLLHMDVPVSLAVGLLWGHGVWATFTGAEGWLDSVTMLVALLLGGRLLEQRGRNHAHDAAMALASRAPLQARLAESQEMVAAKELVPGQRIEVASGEEFPADGRVVYGVATVDRSLVTGESEPTPVQLGDEVVAGSILQGGHVVVEVDLAGDDTLLASMARQLRLAPDRPEVGDRFAPWFTAGTLVAAGVAGLLHGTVDAVAAVLVVACPCALALAGPLTTAAGLGAAARRGLLLSGAEALERLGRVERVVLDKTGTLTGGVPEVVSALDEPLRLAAGLERASTHPIARALRSEALKRGLALPIPSGVVEVVGEGLEGVVDGRRLRLRGGGDGEVVLHDGDTRHTLVLQDRLRPDSAAVVAGLHALGLETLVLSGDREGVARRIAEAAGVGGVQIGTPSEKAEVVRTTDCFVGDGLNDVLALQRAGVGLAMHRGAAPSVMAADGVVAHPSLRPVLAGVVAAREADRARRSSRRRAVVYNLVAVAAALAGFVNPLVAAVAMPLSSALVIAAAVGVEGRVARALHVRCA